MDEPTSSWTAKWIWCSDGEPEPNTYCYMRRTFDLDRVPHSVIARVTADSRYLLFINDSAIERGPARCEPAYQAYDEIEIAPHLHRGKNIISALVYYIGESTAGYVPGRPGFLFDCSFNDIDISTGEKWKAIPASDFKRDLEMRINTQLGFNEVRDARETPVGWTNFHFDDSAWPAARVVGVPPCEPWVRLIPSGLPHQRRVLMPAAGCRMVGIWRGGRDSGSLRQIMESRRRWPLPLDEDEQVYGHVDARGVPVREFCVETSSMPEYGLSIAPGRFVVLDMCHIISGRIVLEFSAQECQILDVTHGEYTEGYGGPSLSTSLIDRFIAREGRQRWETFDKRGFRFLLIDVVGGSMPVTLHFAGATFSSYPVEWHEFACSDPRLNEIWRLSAYTLQLNMEDAYTDCQWRERGQWWGDARIEILGSMYCFGDPTLARRGLLQMAQSQEPDGKVRAFVPTRNDCYIPTWSLCWPLTAWEYFLFTGDVDLLKELYPAIRKSVEYYDQYVRDGLLANPPQWNFIDWTPIDTGDTNAALNAFYYGAINATKQIAAIVGDAVGMDKYLCRMQDTKKAFNAAFWSEDRQAYVDAVREGVQSPVVGQATNCLAIHFGVADEGKIQTVLDTVFNNVMLPFHWTHLGLIDLEKCKDAIIPAGTPYMSFYVVNTLRRAGRHDQAFDYIRKQWGIMLEERDTATREMWELQTGDSSSRAHGWSAAPAYDLPAYVLGVRPLEPGWKKILIEPNLSGLDWARAVIPTPAGDVTIQVREEDGRFDADGVIPDGSEAIIRLPGRSEHLVNGRFHIRRE